MAEDSYPTFDNEDARTESVKVKLSQEHRFVRNIYTEIKSRAKFAVGYGGAYQIWMAVKATAHIEGHIAELGTYQGASAALMATARSLVGRDDKEIHLFDTFEGLPGSSTDADSARFSQGEYACGLPQVQANLAAYSNIVFHQGRFPETTADMEERSYSFVHLDADLYRSTFDALEYFYPRLSKGAIVLSHDAIRRGVQTAFNDFCRPRGLQFYQLFVNQLLLIK